jgi:hypothetical protein
MSEVPQARRAETDEIVAQEPESSGEIGQDPAPRCSRPGCRSLVTRTIDSQGFCDRHRTVREDAPVAYCYCGVPAVKIEVRVPLCNTHTPSQAAAAAAAAG